MSVVDTMLAIGLCFALAFSVGNKRAWGWLLAAATAYIVSTLYWRSGQPYAPFIGGMLDALICLAVYFFAAYRWELWVWRLFQVSVGVNLYYLAGTYGIVPSLGHNDYSIMLEAINWLALAFIGGTGAFQDAGASYASDAATRPWYSIHRIVGALYRARTHAPFHKAGR